MGVASKGVFPFEENMTPMANKVSISFIFKEKHEITIFKRKEEIMRNNANKTDFSKTKEL